MFTRFVAPFHIQPRFTVIKSNPYFFTTTSLALKQKKELHPVDRVASTPEEIKAINNAAHHILEEDLEHDALGMKQRHHEHQMTWKEAEEEVQASEIPQLPSGEKE